MATTLEISQLGSSVLRQPAAAIEDLDNPLIQQLIDNLVTTLHQAGGVGIAAPQVGVSQQLIVVASRPTLRYPQAPQMDPVPMLNPRLVNHSTEQEKGWEGCLSIPGMRGLVPRYRQIAIEYQDRQGYWRQQNLTDFVARIFQHEYDHLQGHVFLDRVESTLELMTEQEYQKQVIQQTPTTSAS